ncbi:MAG: 2OG-Fe(II) oxygenase family protein [Gammaproteobacteria bacterium]
MSMTTIDYINLNDLSEEEKINLTKKMYQEKSYFQTLYNSDSVELACDEIAKKFRNEIVRILQKKNLLNKPVELENLHNQVSDVMRAYNFDDGVNKISTYFYDTDAQFMEVYYSFIQFLRNHFLTEPFYFQKTPTIRIHCPYAKNNNHYPRYHTDIGYGHPPEEMNIWLPLTHILSGHGFKAMSLPDSKQILEKFNYDFTQFIKHAIHDKEFSNYCNDLAVPVSTDFGKMIVFDSRCIHSGMPLFKHTRVSMDIRIIPVSRYKQMRVTYQGSGRRKVIFSPGHCYHEQDSDSFFSYKGKHL